METRFKGNQEKQEKLANVSYFNFINYDVLKNQRN